MIDMTDAAPGLVPHRAVVPGRAPSRVIAQPRKALTTTTDTTPKVKSSQWPAMSPAIESGIDRAIMLPTIPCATTKGARGSDRRTPYEATTMAAIKGPSISAAGACSHNRSPPRAAERTKRTVQLRQLAIVYCTNSSASPFIPARVAISSADAAASLASSVPRSTSETEGLPFRNAG